MIRGQETPSEKVTELRTLPKNIEAEVAVLGAILLDNEALGVVSEYVTTDDFFKEAHRLIFKAMRELDDKNEPIDLITLTDALKSQGLLEKVEGVAYLASIADAVTTSANVASYAKIIREKAVLRNLIRVSTDIITECYRSEDREISDCLDRAERAIFDVSSKHAVSQVVPIREVVKESFKQIEERFEKKALITGLSSGFSGLDKLTAGFQPSDLIVIAARPSVGKTALALNIAQNVALRQNVGVVLFSLEMSKQQIVQRMLCSEARINGMKLRGGFLSDEDWPRLTRAAGLLSESPLYIDDSSGITPFEVKARARRLAMDKEKRIGLIVVDYMQLMRGGGRFESREREISEISRSLKALAKELNLPVIALSQLNRSLESRQDKRPQLSDLRESGAIEQDADIISFIYRDEVYHRESEEEGIAEVIIAKQRNGPTGVVKLAFLKDFTRFENLATDA